MFEFTLTPAGQIEPWGTPGNASLSWFALSDGSYWIDLGVAQLFEYAQAPGWPRHVEYQVARLHDDLLELLPDALARVPEDVAALLARSSAPLALRALVRAQALEDAEEHELADAACLFSRRFLSTGYLRPGAEICLWSTADTVYVEWDNRDKVVEGRVAWTATRGRHAIDRSAFLDGLAKFHSRFTSAMRDRVAEAVAHRSRTEARLDHQELMMEQARREALLDERLCTPVTLPNWDLVIRAVEKVGRLHRALNDSPEDHG